MPLERFKRNADKVIANLGKEAGIAEPKEIMPLAIEKLADYFGVSQRAAKNRLIDVGYGEAMRT